MDRIRIYLKEEKLFLEEAIEKTKEDTLDKGYLIEYLKRKEFIIMITKILTIEEEIELIKQEEKIEGRKEGVIMTAKNLLSIGMDKATISKVTGLSVEEIENLEKQDQELDSRI